MIMEINVNAITPEKLYLILPFKVSQLAVLFAQKAHITKDEAIRIIYRSNTYQRLEQESTKLWHLGPVALLEILTEELNITPVSPFPAP
jgi:hypothetical protein